MLMCYISIFLCLLFCIATKIKAKNSYNPGFLFMGIWFVALLFYSFRLYGIKQCSDITYYIIFFGLLFWEIGMILANRFEIVKIRSVNPSEYSDSFNKHINPFIYRVLTIIAYAVLLYTAFQGVSKILSGATIYDIRYTLREDILSNVAINIVYNYFAMPMSFLVLHINLNSIFSNQKGKRNTIHIFEVLFVVITSMLTEGGRFIFLFLSIDVIILSMINKKSKKTDLVDINARKLNKKNKKRMRLILLFCIVAFVFITTARDSEILKTIYMYTCGCVPFMDNLVGKFSGEYSYGLTSINGFIRPIFTLLKSIGIISALPLGVLHAEDLLSVVESPVWLADGILYNGFSSLFYDFYVDGGFPLVIVFSFIWGWICTRCYKSFKSNPSEKNTIIYLLLIQAILTSILKFQFVSFHYALTYVYLCLIFINIRSQNEVHDVYY